jgi:two-component system, cell cycle response regulator
MNKEYSVALLGFTAFERSALQSFFRLAARRDPSYVHTESSFTAHVVLVDADLADARDKAQPWVERSVYVGASAPAGALGHMKRPLNMMAMLKLLDVLLAKPEPAPSTATLAPVATPNPLRAVPTPKPAVRPTTALVQELLAQSIVPSRPMVSRLDNILVVDDSDVALRFMANCLGRFGFDVHLAKSGEEALQRVSEEHFEFVFMDVSMPGIDGYQTCKLIKRRPYPEGREPPTVVMLTSRSGMVDKMRGTLAGCDAYLTKPLQHNELMKVIGERVDASNPSVFVKTKSEPHL